MGDSWGSRLCSDPLETPTNPCPSAPACPHPHLLGRGAAGDVPALGTALGTRGGQMRWHREWGQGRAWRHPGGEALCQQGSVCLMAGPLAGLSNEPRGTMAVMMEPSLLPCSHIGASLIPRGQHQHGIEGPGDGQHLPDCRLGWEMPSGCPTALEAQDDSAWGHRQALGTGDLSAPRYLPHGTGDPDCPVPLAVQGRGAPWGGGRSWPGTARGCKLVSSGVVKR